MNSEIGLDETYRFSYVFIIGIEEFAIDYFDLSINDIDPSLRDITLVYALGDNSYDIKDILEGEVPRSINYLSLMVYPNGNSEGFFITENTFFDENTFAVEFNNAFVKLNDDMVYGEGVASYAARFSFFEADFELILRQ
ncbi:MAG: hypothetical protein JXR03_06070 [Cyclobacteriaceae bacterium]